MATRRFLSLDHLADYLERQFSRDLEDRVRNGAQRLIFEVSTRIRLRAPVDTGFLRSTIVEWVGVPDKSTRVSSGGGGANMRRVQSKHRGLEDIGISVWAPYAAIPELGLYPQPGGDKTSGGYSTQAPEGYVGASIREVDQLLSAGALDLTGEFVAS